MSESEETKSVDSEDGLAVPVRRRRPNAEEMQQQSRRGMLILIPLVMIGAGIVFFVFSGMKNQAIYSKPVNELVAEKARFAGGR